MLRWDRVEVVMERQPLCKVMVYERPHGEEQEAPQANSRESEHGHAWLFYHSRGILGWRAAL
ncbi:MAG: hypothetical protein HY686_03245 [Chloroflexi bacterium]|nr:hypothetical protein [Chloroflexota bacterium]